jgi:hypothetical protein
MNDIKEGIAFIVRGIENLTKAFFEMFAPTPENLAKIFEGVKLAQKHLPPDIEKLLD